MAVMTYRGDTQVITGNLLRLVGNTHSAVSAM